MSEYPVPPNPAPDGLLVTPVWTTVTTPFDAMTEQRKAKQVFAKYDVSLKYPEGMTNADILTLWDFYMARRGAYQAFYIYDLLSQAHTGLFVGWGDGTTTTFDLPGKSTSGHTIYIDSSAITLTDAGITDTVDLADVRLSLVNGTAFVDFSAAGTLTPYIGGKLTLTDSAGKKAIGYIHHNASDDPFVQMTYAASGSSGIAVADNDNIDFGTGNYTLAWKGSLPDWSPSEEIWLVYKNETARLSVYTSGATTYIYCYYDGTGSRNKRIAINLTDGTEHEITAVVTRETAAVDGSVVFYVDGVQQGASQSITAGVPPDASSADILYISGYTAKRYASTNKSVILYNRALSAAEVLSLYQNGIAEADKWGKNNVTSGSVSLANIRLSLVDGTAFVDFSAPGALNYLNGKLTLTDSAGKKAIGYIKAAGTGETLGDELIVDRSFDAAGSWTAQAGWSISGGKAQATAASSTVWQAHGGNMRKLYKIVTNCDSYTSGTWYPRYGAYPISYNSSGEKTAYIVATTDNTFGILGSSLTATFTDVSGKQVLTPSTSGATIVSTPGGTTYNWTSIEAGFNYNDPAGYTYTIDKLGATLALEPEGIQTDKWYDSSTNDLDASYPTTGWSVYPLGNGVTITSTPGGTTYNWASVESGFNYNDAGGYTYEISKGAVLTGGGAEGSDRISFAPAPTLGKLITCDLTGYLRMRVRFKEDKFSRQSLTHLISAGGTIELKGLSPEDL